MNYLDVFAFHHLGELYLKLNDIESAAHYFGKAMEISPRHLDRGISFGKTLIRMKMKNRAINTFEKVLRLSGSTMELKEEIADFCISEGVNEYAVKLLESIVRENKNRADIFFKLGELLEKMSEVKKAIDYLEKASNLDDENIITKIHLAKNYLALKKPMMAEKSLKIILDRNPNNELAIELLKQCG
jgi:tetratricopeptide (TPR) repeat protein